MVERSLSELDLTALSHRPFHPSPPAWEDQVLYFLMLDRFSDGSENNYRDNNGLPVAGGTTPAFRPEDAGNAVQNEHDARRWRDAGGRWVGGNLKGLTGKIGYLKRLGVTALWVSPVFKQVAFQDTYHGYGIQNFLDVDPHFGTREELKSLVETAHGYGIYVILDIILNHAGNVFSYDADRFWTGTAMDARWDGRPYTVEGFNDPQGHPSLPFGPVAATAWPDGAIWPTEFQDPSCYTCKGRIRNWDYFPEYLEGDFCDLKDIHLGHGDIERHTSSPALMALCRAYKFWMAYLDLDGFRVDTVKHMDPGAARFFTSVIHEFAQSLGKENFYLIAEITGGRKNAFETLEAVGMNAALGIDDVQPKLENLVKGRGNPKDYFDLFRNSLLVQKESHVWFRNKVVTQVDDHDKVSQGDNKARFCADDTGRKLALNVLALNVTTLGIPCVYYGTEQGFDGQGGSDRYIREAMFGGEFGAFRSRGRHFFDEGHPVYQELAKILDLRRRKIALRRGRQYLREISGDGQSFGLPHKIGDRMRSVVPWSRLFNDEEVLLAINTDADHARTAWVIVDSGLHQAGDRMECLYSTDPAQVGSEVVVREIRENTRAVQLTVPPAGFVVFE